MFGLMQAEEERNHADFFNCGVKPPKTLIISFHEEEARSYKWSETDECWSVQRPQGHTFYLIDQIAGQRKSCASDCCIVL
jgi:hypothetical protein